MTLLYRDRPKIRLGVDEVAGLLNVLDAAIDEQADSGELSTFYLVGARVALEIVFEQEHVELPQDFMRLFEQKIKALETDWSE
jgi:hypothetical protein